MNRRLIVTLVLFLAIIAFPYWIYLPALGLAIFFLRFYWEGIILAFIVDVLYGHSPYMGLSFSFPLAIYVSIFVLILLPIHEQIRFDA